jgi:hypothetical protein
MHQPEFKEIGEKKKKERYELHQLVAQFGKSVSQQLLCLVLYSGRFLFQQMTPQKVRYCYILKAQYAFVYMLIQ